MIVSLNDTCRYIHSCTEMLLIDISYMGSAKLAAYGTLCTVLRGAIVHVHVNNNNNNLLEFPYKWYYLK